MSEWQTIETAPKDGADVLLARTAWGVWRPIIAGWFEDGWYTFDDADRRIPDEYITHWQPLPPPPTHAPKGEGE